MTTSVIVVVITFAALAARIPFLGTESGDYVSYVHPWYNHIRDVGLAQALSTDFSNYSPPYLYLLGLAAAIPVPALLAIKAISIAFDIALAAAAAILVRQAGGHVRALVTYALVLFIPTVILNSASWAQCDAVYAVFAVLGVPLLIRDRPYWAMLCIGVATAIKLQAVFLLPLFALFTLRRKMPVWAWVALPLPYIMAALPAWAAGRSFTGLALIYKNQSDTYQQLSLNAPSVYAWVTGREDFGPYAAVLGLAVIGVIVLAGWRARIDLSPEVTVLWATMFAVLVPFVLPRMHERYFFLGDVLSVAYAVLNPRRWFVPVLVIMGSLFSYLPYLYGFKPVPISWLSLLILAALLTMLHDIFETRWHSLLRRPDLLPADDPGTASLLNAAGSARETAEQG